MTVPQPLRGRVVVDLSQYIAGSVCGQVLADFGATVVKVEPPDGDPSRRLARTRHGSVYFRYYNTGKSSVRLSLAESAHRDELEQLLAAADAVVMNFSRATLLKHGLDWASLHTRHPRLVVTMVTSYGADDPRTAFDTIAQAASGFGHVNADADGTPRVSAGYPTDVFSGLHAGLSTAMALLDEAVVDGVLIDAAMVEVAMTALVGPMTLWAAEEGTSATGQGNRDSATCPSNIFACADGHAYVYAGLDRHWARLAPVVGGPEAPLAERLADPVRFEAPVARWAQRLTVAEVCSTLADVGIPAGPVVDPVSALATLHSTRPDAVVVPDDHGAGVPQYPVTFSGSRIPRAAAPADHQAARSPR
jgi:crotonobetainyl-CoA:carnitine CoA-transferase CaiB-like acyl-CoA transferase